jgi:hypothetical protein
MAKTLSMFDQMLFKLECGHSVVLGRLRDKDEWTCEECGRSTDMHKSPHREQLAQSWGTATQIDLQAKARGETIFRAG